MLTGRTMNAPPPHTLLDRLHTAWHARALSLKAVSFALVGLVNSAIDFSVFWTAARYFGWHLVPANMLSWSVAVSCSYVMNSFITFGPESGHTLRWPAYFTFVASGIAGMVASTATLYALAFALPLVAAKLLSILVSFVVNFAFSHLVVFRERKS